MWRSPLPAPRVAASTEAAILHHSWVLPPVLVECPYCGGEFLAPDLRRENLHNQRARCPDCGRHVNGAYKDAVRRRDEDEKVVVGGVVVFTKLQLFLLECVSLLSSSGLIEMRRLSGVHGAKQHLGACLRLGLLAPSGARRYVLTNEGRVVVRLAMMRYGVSA